MLRLTKYRIEPVGELAERIALNAARLTAPCYRPDAIYNMDQAGWPGDWEGRTLLALTSLWNATGAKPAYLDPVVESLPEHLNEAGYLGPVRCENGPVDEQQLSGHNWLVRGLSEYYLRTKDDFVRTALFRIVANLYLPLKGLYKTYPADPGSRKNMERGGYSGEINGTVSGWKVSSDIGCAFMCLDALSQVYEIFRIPAVKELLDEMIDAYEKIDFTGVNMQTHATLSALRGIIRLAGAEFIDNSDRSRYLGIARRVFDLYVRSGMTENYANYNWFGRFDTWTEPCAIVDSEMAALGLFRLTEDTDYLTLANRIRYNALAYAQRPNGGFGTDKCVSDTVPAEILSPSGEGICEAYWCCTMRGAEGLRALCDHTVLASGEADEDGFETLWLCFTTDANICSDRFEISVRSALPYTCSYKVRIRSLKEDVRLRLKIYTPAGIDERVAAVSGGETAEICGKSELKETRVRTKNGRMFKYMRGDLVLAEKAGQEKTEKQSGGNIELSPLCDMIDLSIDEAGRDRRRVLFR